jgi:NADH:ubiquinone oxidoreductase subunit K
MSTLDIFNNRNKLLMLMSAVLMVLAIILIIFNFTGVMEYTKHNTITFSMLFVAALFFFIKNLRRQ